MTATVTPLRAAHDTTDTATSRAERIVACERDADALDSRSEDLRWEAADLIAEEVASGKTQTQVAAEIGKSQQHVSIMARVAVYYRGSDSLETFAQAYARFKSSRKDRKPKAADVHTQVTKLLSKIQDSAREVEHLCAGSGDEMLRALAETMLSSLREDLDGILDHTAGDSEPVESDAPATPRTTDVREWHGTPQSDDERTLSTVTNMFNRWVADTYAIETDETMRRSADVRGKTITNLEIHRDAIDSTLGRLAGFETPVVESDAVDVPPVGELPARTVGDARWHQVAVSSGLTCRARKYADRATTAVNGYTGPGSTELDRLLAEQLTNAANAPRTHATLRGLDAITELVAALRAAA